MRKKKDCPLCRSKYTPLDPNGGIYSFLKSLCDYHELTWEDASITCLLPCCIYVDHEIIYSSCSLNCQFRDVLNYFKDQMRYEKEEDEKNGKHQV